MTRGVVLLFALLAVSACKGGIFDGGKIIPAGHAYIHLASNPSASVTSR